MRALIAPSLIAVTMLAIAANALHGGDAGAAHQSSVQASQAAFAELDRLLAQLDAADRTDDIAQAARTTADAQALADSAKAGGAGVKTPPPPVPVVQIAQNPAPPPVEVKVDTQPKAGLVTAEAEDPEKRAEEILEKLGLSSGEQMLPDGQFGFVAVSSPVAIQIPPGKKGYVTAREIAYQIADLQARAKVAKYLDTQVAAGRNFAKAREDSDQERTLSPAEAALARARQVADDELDAELRKMNVDPAIYQALPPSQKRTVLAQAFEQSIKAQSNALLAGVATLFVCEGPSEGKQAIVVGLIWSERLAKLCNAALSPQVVGKPVSAESRKAAMSRLPLNNPLQLVRYFGAQMISDGQGNQWIVAFGQSNYNDPDDLDIAYEEASNNALAALAAFVNERIDYASMTQKRQVMEKFNDGSGYVDQSKFTMTEIKGNTKWEGQGQSAIKQWKTTINGAKVCGVVLAWSPYSRTQAQLMKQKMQAAVNPRTAAGSGSSSPAQSAAQPGASGAGNSGASEY